MIYLDNSATAKPCAAAVFVARELLEESWYNPSAPYGEAAHVEKRLSNDREKIMQTLGVQQANLIFTGSGTESDSLAILGSAACFRGSKRILLFSAEHPAVLETAVQLAAMGHTVQWIPATDEGIADFDALSAMLDEDVALVSCMQVNNETGAVQPLIAIGEMIRQTCPQALFHADGVQGYLRIPLSLAEAGISLYSISAHKIHGLKGIGALYVRKGVKIAARIHGGGQEKGLRSGTENTAGIAAFATAADWVIRQEDRFELLQKMKLCLYHSLRENVEGLRVNGPTPESKNAAPHILNVSFPGVGGEVMLHAMEAEGVLVGTGAACSSKKRRISPAFKAMRAPTWAAESAIRFSFGMMNTMEESEAAAHAAIRCWQRYKAYQRR